MTRTEFVDIAGVESRLKEISDKHGFTVDELLQVIQKESNYKLGAVNKFTNATGIIQFMPATAKGLGTTIEEIKEMDALEQLDLLDKFFDQNHTKGQHPYITVAYPAAGKYGMDDVIAGPASKIAEQNPVWVGEDGNVTKRSILNYVSSGKDVSGDESKGATYQVYDANLGKYTTFTTSWDGKNWKHTAEGDDYTQDEINNIADMFVSPLGNLPGGGTSIFKEEKASDGETTVYIPYASSEGNEQTEFQSRFAFVGEKPIQLTLSVAKLDEMFDAYSKYNQEQNSNFNPLDSDKEQNNKLLAESTKRLNDAAKTYKATRKPEDKTEYERIKEEHDNFVNTLNTGTGVLGTLVEKEKRLREQLTKIQENPLDFSDTDIDEIQKKIDKTAIEISIEQGNPRSTGPFGYGLDDLKDINLEVDSFGLDGKIYDSTEQKNNEPGPISSISITTNIPEVFVTDNRDEEIDKEKEEEEIVEKDPNVKTENYLDGLGNLGTTLERGLGIVQEIKELIGNNDDLELAALGKRAYMESLKTIKPDDIPPLSNMYKEHLNQLGQLSKMGFSVEEAQKARAEIDGAYGKGIENAVRGTAGDRAKFLAMSGVLDSQRQSALLDFAAKDSELNRRNQDSYTKALSFAEEYNLNKSKAERADDLKLEVSRQQGASNFAAKVFQTLQQKQSDAQLNPIIRKYKQMINNNMSTNTPLLQNPFSYFGTNNNVYNQNTQNNQNTNQGA